MAIVYRSVKGSNLTPTEVDTNFSDLVTAIDAKVADNLTASTTVAPSKSAVNTGLALKADYNAPATVSGTTATLVAATHGNRDNFCTNASGCAFTWDNTNGMAVGTMFTVHQNAAGAVSIVAGTGGTVELAPGVAGAETTGIRGWIDCLVVATNTLRITGRSVKRSLLDGYSAATITVGSTLVGFGMEIGSTGTITARTPSTTNAFTRMKRGAIVGAAAAANTPAGLRPGLTGGFLTLQSVPWKTEQAAGISDAIASGGRFFMGLVPNGTTLPTTTNPSAQINCIGLGADDADSEMSMMHNDGSGTATKITLNGGSGFPANTQNADMYKLELTYIPTGTERFIYTVTNMISGVSVSGTITTNFPANTQILGNMIYRNSGASATRPEIDILGFLSGTFVDLDVL